MASCCQNPAPRAQQAWAVGGSMGSAGPSAGRPVLVPFPSLADAWLYAAASRPNGGGGPFSVTLLQTWGRHTCSLL